MNIQRGEKVEFISHADLVEQFNGNIYNWIKSICGNKTYANVGSASNKNEAVFNAHECTEDVGVCTYDEILADEAKNGNIQLLEMEEEMLIESLKDIDIKRINGLFNNYLKSEESRLEKRLSEIEFSMSQEWSRTEKVVKCYALVADFKQGVL